MGEYLNVFLPISLGLGKGMGWWEASVENNVSENSDIKTSMSKRGSISMGAGASLFLRETRRAVASSS